MVVHPASRSTRRVPSGCTHAVAELVPKSMLQTVDIQVPCSVKRALAASLQSVLTTGGNDGARDVEAVIFGHSVRCTI